MNRIVISFLTIGLAGGAAPLSAQPKLVGVAQVAGNASDLSGIEGNLEDGTPANQLGGFGSAIAWSGTGNIYWTVTDRGPADGITSFHTRLHKFAIDFTETNKLRATLLASIPLRDTDGSPFIGLTSAFDLEAVGPRVAMNEKGRRFDPEGIALYHSGVVIADEYGPYVFEFDLNGRKLRNLNVSSKFQVEVQSGDPEGEDPPNNVKGRQSNRGMEGLTFNQTNGMLYGIMQSPLIQDNAMNTAESRVGTIVRIVEINPVSRKSQREFGYLLDSPKNGISEILAVNGTDFLVLERDGKAGVDSKSKKIYRISTSGATDVSGIESLPCCAMPHGVKAVKKSLLIDLLDESFKLAGASFPQKPEGLTFGPDFPGGDKLLLVTVDNDFITSKPSSIWAFRVGPL